MSSVQPGILISVIIPAYNSATYISTMLDSICVQTYANYEILVAYDTKSTDDTLEILQRYAENNQLIIYPSNDESVGQARNRDLHIAKGDYIIFMDADDIIVPTYLEDLLDVLYENPDLDVIGSRRIDTNETQVRDTYYMALQTVKDIAVFDNITALHLWIVGKEFSVTPWSYLVRKDYLKINNILFPNYSNGEDQVWVVQLFLYTNRIGINRKLGYVHILHPFSLSQHSISYKNIGIIYAVPKKIFSTILFQHHSFT